MKMKTLSLAVLLLCPSAHAQDTVNLKADILGASLDDVDGILARLSQHRQAENRQLYALLAIDRKTLFGGPNEVVLHKVMKVVSYLGDCRDVEAVEPILRIVEFPPGLIGTAPFSPDSYPTVKALVKIGIPSARAAIEEAKKIQINWTGSGSSNFETNKTTGSVGFVVGVSENTLKRVRLDCLIGVVHGVFGDQLGALFVNTESGKSGKLADFKKDYFLWYPRTK
jgi:hypothetical protein